jgi:hypothetical protein
MPEKAVVRGEANPPAPSGSRRADGRARPLEHVPLLPTLPEPSHPNAWLTGLGHSPANGSRSRMTTSCTRPNHRKSWWRGWAVTDRRPTACFEYRRTSWQRPAWRRCEVQVPKAPRSGREPSASATIVDVVVEGLEIAPQACVLDSGATAVRFGAHVAELSGIDLSNALKAQLAVGGAVISARTAEVSLRVEDETESYAWSAPVWFCDQWAPSFGLLGLTGFFDHFRVVIASYEEWFELAPVA